MSDEIENLLKAMDRIKRKSNMVFESGNYIGTGVGNKENLRQKTPLSKNGKDAVAQEKLNQFKETGSISITDEQEVENIADKAVNDFMDKLTSEL